MNALLPPPIAAEREELPRPPRVPREVRETSRPGRIEKSLDSALRRNPEHPRDGVDTDAASVARVAVRYWGDQAGDMLRRAAKIADERARR